MLEYDYYQLNLKNSVKTNVNIDTLIETLTEFLNALVLYNVDFEIVNEIFKQVKFKYSKTPELKSEHLIASK